MRKIPSLFQRNYEGDRLVRDEVVPGCEWVLRGEGVATKKYDGTCCMVRGGRLFKRYEVKRGRKPPALFEAACDPDPNTGKQQGWVPVGDGPEDRWHREAVLPYVDGTYELIGPKVQGNPEGVAAHVLVPHGEVLVENAPRDFAGLRAFLDGGGMEGIVWRHADGRMAKVKARDFGVSRTPA